MHWYQLPNKYQMYLILMIGNGEQPLEYDGFRLVIINRGIFLKVMTKCLWNLFLLVFNLFVIIGILFHDYSNGFIVFSDHESCYIQISCLGNPMFEAIETKTIKLAARTHCETEKSI